MVRRQATFAGWVVDRHQYGKTLPVLVTILSAAALGAWSIWAKDGLLWDVFSGRRQWAALEAAASIHVRERSVMALAQSALCLGLVFAIGQPNPSKVSDKRPKTTEKACLRLLNHVRVLYASWSAYYLVLGMSLWSGSPDAADMRLTQFAGEVLCDALSVLTALLFFWIFVEFTDVTIAGHDDLEGLEAKHAALLRERKNVTRYWRWASGCVAAVVIVGLFYLYLRVRAIGWVREFEPAVLRAADAVIALASGSTQALVTACFLPRRINPGVLPLGLLMCYSTLQMTSVLFDLKSVQVLATMAAMMLKTLLWLVFVWTLSSGRLWEYAVEFREALEPLGEAKPRNA